MQRDALHFFSLAKQRSVPSTDPLPPSFNGHVVMIVGAKFTTHLAVRSGIGPAVLKGYSEVPHMGTSIRIDRLLVDRGLVESRARAQALIERGAVEVLGRVVAKPSLLVDPAADVRLRASLPYVSRAGEKLEGALDALGVDVRGVGALDVGSSTGGFTDCLLRRGARAVIAVDVGKGQLHQSLRTDPRVLSFEETDVRALERDSLPFRPDLTVVDASFVSLGVLAEALARLCPPESVLVALIKPQFEVGPVRARKAKGVIRDRGEREESIRRASHALEVAGFELLGGVESAVSGEKGNVEHFVHARRKSAG
jgi:23S rRNA (cytidine1920-2'-O)/16S rRNA (cytidine1409-2'-O)-methyltransferase